jgi:hypothetical protein
MGYVLILNFFHIVTRLVFSSSYGCNKTIKSVVLDVIYYIYDVVFTHEFFYHIIQKDLLNNHKM